MATYKQIEDLLKIINRLNSRVCKLEKSGGGYSYIVENYNDLQATATSPQTNEFAYIKNSQGTAWLPWNLGGTYYPSGVWFYTGTEWINDKSQIANELYLNNIDISTLQTDLTNHINDLANPHQTPTGGGGTIYSSFLTDTTTLYYYRSYISDGVQANWVVERFLASDLNTVVVANIVNNGSYTTQATAWAARASLIYA